MQTIRFLDRLALQEVNPDPANILHLSSMLASTESASKWVLAHITRLWVPRGGGALGAVLRCAVVDRVRPLLLGAATALLAAVTAPAVALASPDAAAGGHVDPIAQVVLGLAVILIVA